MSLYKHYETSSEESISASKSYLFSLQKLLRPGELVNGLTHLIGVFMSIPGLYILLKHAPVGSSFIYYFSLYVFGISLFLLYSASTTYHLLNISEKCTRILRRIDHMMIYVLIAGTYTPICIIALNGWWEWGLLTAVWALACTGILLTIIWFNAPRWVSTLIYLFMGWMVVVAFYPIYQAVSVSGLFWLALGGIFYTVGAIIYVLKKPDINLKYLGFHEIFHLFVLAGSACQYCMVYRCLLSI